MIEQLSNESWSIIFMKNLRISLDGLFFNFGWSFFKDFLQLQSLTRLKNMAKKKYDPDISGTGFTINGISGPEKILRSNMAF